VTTFQQLLFVLVFTSVLALVNLYVYRRFFRRLSPFMRKAGALLMLLIMAGEILFAVDRMYGLMPDSIIVYLFLGTLIGSTFMLFVVAVIYDLTLSISQKVPFDQERRRVIKVIFDSAVLIAAVSYLWRGVSEGTKLPEVKDVIVRVKDFPFSGFTIVQLTDVHIGRTIKRDFLAEIVARTNAMKPDMVVITGDLFDLQPEKIMDDLQPLKDLQAPTYFITGNHEYYVGVESVFETIETLGIRALSNEAIRFGNDTGSFNLVGLNDLSGNRFDTRPPDAEAAYRDLDQSRPTIVLSHQPRSIPLVEGKRCDLMLCGHTHGGQIFPFGLLVMLAQPYLYGLHEFAPGKQIYVSRGTGYWGPPLRVLAPSEISRIVITTA
jgi:predicted MPP superfamily phosphohydrolase